MPAAKKEQSVKVEDEKKTLLSQSGSDNDGSDSETEWWDQEDLNVSKRGEKRWDTLSHNGVVFPDPYAPHGIPIKYEGRALALAPPVEEIATMFAAMTENIQYSHNEVFRANFFSCFRKLLNTHMPGHPVRDLSLCDFSPIYAHLVAEKEKRLAMTKEEKNKKKEENQAMDKKYKFCLWDGRVEELASYRVEPPGLFRGRGKHPRQGILKNRITPEDITLNLGKEAPVPECPPGHKWKAVIHDQHVTWLAMWHDNVTGNQKYVMMAPTSSVKGMSDREKFERARRLKDKVDDIRKDYREGWASSSALQNQLGVALYFIDFLALRVGNEKGEEEADTVGCCSLRVQHVTPLEDDVLRFDFPGKDSIQYVNDVKVDPKVYQLVKRFRSGKTIAHELFDMVSPSTLNDYLKKHMVDLTAKVFRTYNASKCLQDQLAIDPPAKSTPVTEKLVHFNKCNTDVAILCNHQRAVPKSFNVQMHKLGAVADNVTHNIAQLQQAELTMKAKGAKAAVTEFFAEEDRVQWAWLNEYGSEEEKAAYKKVVKERDIEAIASRAASGKKSSGSKKSSSTPKKGSSKKAAKGAKAAKASPKKKTIKAEEDSDADDDLLALVTRKAAPKKAAPKKVKKEESESEEESDDDEQPIKKKTRAASKPAAKKAAPKKAAPKKAAPKKGGKK